MLTKERTTKFGTKNLVLVAICLCVTTFVAAQPELSPSPSPLSPTCTPSVGNVTVALEEVISGITAPTVIEFGRLPGDTLDSMFIAEQTGVILVLKQNPENGSYAHSEPLVFLNITDKLVDLSPQYDERGVIGMALHPDFTNNGRFFLWYSTRQVSGVNFTTELTRPENCDPNVFDDVGRLEEYVADTSRTGANSLPAVSPSRIIYQIKKPYMNHNGINSLRFQPATNLLYHGLGDGGYAYDPFENAQNTDKMLGKIFRIDIGTLPAGASCNQTVDTFSALAEVCPDIAASIDTFAYGIRNAGGISFSASLGAIYADVGQDEYEEVDILPVDSSEVNLGWDVFEGFSCVKTDTCPNVTSVRRSAPSRLTLAPVAVLPHVDERLQDPIAILGGFIYQGDQLPCELHNAYIFASYQTRGGGALYYLNVFNSLGEYAFGPKGYLDTMLCQDPESSSAELLARQNEAEARVNLLHLESGRIPSVYVIGYDPSRADMYIGVDAASGSVPNESVIYRLVPSTPNQ